MGTTKDSQRRNPNQEVLPKKPKRKQQDIRPRLMIDLEAASEKKAAVAVAVVEDTPLVTVVTDDGRDHGRFQCEQEIVTTTVIVTVIESLSVITGMTATLDEATHPVVAVGVVRPPEDMTGTENGIGIGIGIGNANVSVSVSGISTEIDAEIEVQRGTAAFVIDEGRQIETGIIAIGIAAENETVKGNGTEIVLTINVVELTILALALVPGKETVNATGPGIEFVADPAKDLEIVTVTGEIETVSVTDLGIEIGTDETGTANAL